MSADLVSRWTTRKWAISRSELNQAWFQYSRKSIDGDLPPNHPDFLSYCVFHYAFAKGWLAARGLDPTLNVVEYV